MKSELSTCVYPTIDLEALSEIIEHAWKAANLEYLGYQLRVNNISISVKDIQPLMDLLQIKTV